MTPTEAIESLDTLLATLETKTDAIRQQALSVERQWEGLKRVGGAREDHAASLLATLQDPLLHLSTQCLNTVDQIAAMRRCPFGG